MRSLLITFIISLLVLSCADKTELATDISLSPVFSDNMVLQQKQPVKIWGKASAGGVVKVIFNGQEKRSVAGSDNTWNVTLDPLNAGGSYKLKVMEKTP